MLGSLKSQAQKPGKKGVNPMKINRERAPYPREFPLFFFFLLSAFLRHKFIRNFPKSRIKYDFDMSQKRLIEAKAIFRLFFKEMELSTPTLPGTFFLAVRSYDILW